MIRKALYAIILAMSTVYPKISILTYIHHHHVLQSFNMLANDCLYIWLGIKAAVGLYINKSILFVNKLQGLKLMYRTAIGL